MQAELRKLAESLRQLSQTRQEDKQIKIAKIILAAKGLGLLQKQLGK